MTDSNKDKKTQSVLFIENPYGLSEIEIAEAQEAAENEDPLLDDVQTETFFEDLESQLQSSDTIEIDNQNSEARVLQTDPVLNLDQTANQEGLLQKVAEAIEAQTQNDVNNWQSLTAESASESSIRLAQEISEDMALAKSLTELQSTEEIVSLDPEVAKAMPGRDDSGALNIQELESSIEAVLFMTDKPVGLKRLIEVLGIESDHPEFVKAIENLKIRYQGYQHGIELVEVAQGYQLRTKITRQAIAKKMAKVQTQRLSSGAMETLAIVAYRQPVLKDDIDSVRGVDSSHFVRTLMERKLIRIAGRSELPGRPLIYETTEEFLELFGLKDLQSMPSLRELEQMIPQSAGKDEEDPRVVQMRKMVSQMKMDVSTLLDYNPEEDEKLLADIKQKVSSISVSTPYLEEQKALEKAAELAAKQAEQNQNMDAQPGLNLN